MDSKSEDSPKKDLRTYWNNLAPGRQKLLKLFPLLLILLSLPLTVWFIQQTQNTQQKAAAPDQLEAEGGVLGGNATIVTDTSASGGQSVRFSQTNPTQSPSPTLTPTTTSRKVINVSSISALKTALADNTVDEIVVTNGTYRVSAAGSQASNSLWIGSAYASRTRPILVRSQTIGGVIFDGGGTTWFGGISFEEGAHDQTWQGFKWSGGTPGGRSDSGDSGTGVITFGGYRNAPPAHHITLQDSEVSGLTDYVTATGTTTTHGHAVYISMAYGEGPHHITFNRLKFNSTSLNGSTTTPTFNGALHFYHDYLDSDGVPANHFNAHDFTVTNSQIIGGKWAVIIWARTLQNLLIDGLTVTNAQDYGFRYEGGGGITLRNITTTGSGVRGFAPTSYEPGGPYSYPTIPEYTETGVGPANIIFTNSSFN